MVILKLFGSPNKAQTAFERLVLDNPKVGFSYKDMEAHLPTGDKILYRSLGLTENYEKFCGLYIQLIEYDPDSEFRDVARNYLSLKVRFPKDTKTEYNYMNGYQQIYDDCKDKILSSFPDAEWAEYSYLMMNEISRELKRRGCTYKSFEIDENGIKSIQW